MPCAGICYAVVWYVLCRVGICYAVLTGMCYAVILWITLGDFLLASNSAKHTTLNGMAQASLQRH